MPNLHFQCPNGHEFDKLVTGKNELHKWCKHCDKLTEWITITDTGSDRYKQKVCSKCLGNQHIPPVPTPPSDEAKKTRTETCPECGETADHIIAYHQYGRTGGSTVADSSLRFHFNYLEPTA